MLNFRIIPLGLGLIILILDQITKHYIISNFFYGESRSIIDGFFNLVYVRNDGAAWNILSGQRIFLILISISVLIFLLFRGNTIFSKKRLHQVLFGLIIGGIIGNLYDRLIYGWVIDFLDFQFGSYHYPSFNIADSAICVGVILYFIDQWKNHKKVTRV